MAAWGLSSEISRDKGVNSDLDHAPTTATKLSRMDFSGLIAFILTMATFLLALSLGERRVPWNHVLILSLGATCMTFGVLFVLNEGLVAKEPLIPLRLLKKNGVGVFALVQVLVFIGRWSVSMIYTGSCLGGTRLIG